VTESTSGQVKAASRERMEEQMTSLRGLLLHVSGSEESQVQAGIRAARNARAQLPELTMEIVVQGPAVAFLQSASALESELAALNAVPVRVLACGNSMRSVGLEPAELFRDVTVVPAAVAHLAARQLDGWAYIRV
jgi:intracellular sulfur oxidation DsrE/DsrF family protein